MMQRREQKSFSRGFTLVEVVVALVVLGIAAAILIPSMTGWIDKAQTKKCIHEMGQVAQYYEAGVAATGFGKIERINENGITSEAVAQTLGRASSGLSYKDAQGNSVTLHLSDDGMTVTDVVCAKHGSLYTGGVVVVSGLVNTGGDAPNVVLDAVLDIVTTYYKVDADGNILYDANGNPIENSLSNRFVSNYDSTATYGNRTPTILNYLANNGGLLAKMNVQTWSIRNGTTDNINGGEGKRFFYVTDVDISTMTAGTQVRVIKYNESTKNYTVGYITVAQGQNVKDTNQGHDYLTLGTTAGNNTFVGLKNGAFTDYESALNLFNTQDVTKS